MKKTAMLVLAAVVTLAACSKGSFTADFGELFDNTAKDLNTIAGELKNAKDAKAVASALNKVYDTVLVMKTKGAEIEKKHGIKAKGLMPPELKEKNDAFKAAVRNVFSSETQAVMQKYAGSPEVLEAMNKIKNLKG